MDSPRRGNLVMICNTEFHTDPKLTSRRGTEKDAEVVNSIFGDILGFHIVPFQNMSAHDMLQAIIQGNLIANYLFQANLG
jgi:hypothetical protein